MKYVKLNEPYTMKYVPKWATFKLIPKWIERRATRQKKIQPVYIVTDEQGRELVDGGDWHFVARSVGKRYGRKRPVITGGGK